MEPFERPIIRSDLSKTKGGYKDGERHERRDKNIVKVDKRVVLRIEDYAEGKGRGEEQNWKVRVTMT